MIHYTLGLAFTDTHVALIRKTKPNWQAGKLNFIGGKVEQAEPSVDCISREFFEETGVRIDPVDWKYVGKMYRPDDFACDIYTVTSDKVNDVTTTTEEEVILVPFAEFMALPSNQLLSNLKMLYQFTISDDFARTGCELTIAYNPK